MAEAKERLSYAEFLAWAAYRRKYGTLHPGMRLEHAAALVATVVNRMGGGKAEMKDFMPHFEEQPLTLEEAMEQWV